jgi:hypothetical protein
MPRGHDPRELRLWNGPAEAIGAPLEKINGADCHAQRLTLSHWRIDDSYHSSGFQGRKYGVAFGLGTRI